MKPAAEKRKNSRDKRTRKIPSSLESAMASQKPKKKASTTSPFFLPTTKNKNTTTKTGNKTGPIEHNNGTQPADIVNLIHSPKNTKKNEHQDDTTNASTLVTPMSGNTRVSEVEKTTPTSNANKGGDETETPKGTTLQSTETTIREDDDSSETSEENENNESQEGLGTNDPQKKVAINVRPLEQGAHYSRSGGRGTRNGQKRSINIALS